MIRPHFTITITPADDDPDDWIITRDIACDTTELCAMATAAAQEITRIHNEHHLNMRRNN